MVIGCLGAKAQIMFKTEYFGKSSYRISEGDNSEKVGDSKGSAIVYQAGVNVPLSLKLDENNRPTMWAVSIGGAYANLNNDNFKEPLVIDEILNLGINLNYLRPLNNKWSMMASIGGGLFMPTTRLSQARFNNVLGNVGAIFICHLRPNLDLGGGAAFNNSFGFPMIFPTFYLDWKLEGRYNVKASMINGFEISGGYKVNDNISLNIVAEMNGQMAIVEEDDKDKIFTHQYIIAGFRPEIKLGKHIQIPITLGVSAVRPAEINDRKLKSLFRDKSYYFQASPYGSIGLNINF